MPPGPLSPSNIIPGLLLFSLLWFGCLLVAKGIQGAITNEYSADQLATLFGGGLLCIAFGAGSLYIFFCKEWLAEIRLALVQKKYPDAPWLWERRWSTKTIVSDRNSPLSFVWFVLVTMCAGFATVTYINRAAILSRIQGGDGEIIAFFLVLSLLLFPLFSYAVSLLWRQLKLGRSIFEMSTYPGVVGGELRGTIHTRLKKIPHKGFRLELLCDCGHLSSPSRGGKDDMEVTLWRAKKTIGAGHATMGRLGISFPVSFSIPADAQESDAWSLDTRITWTLTASASQKEVDYFCRFDVPVFRARPGPARS